MKKSRLLGLALVFVSVGMLVSSDAAKALSSIWTQGYQTGYFDLQPADHSCYGWWNPAALDCFVIPEGLYGVGSVSSLMNVIKSNYDSGDYARKTGAAYIVHSMLGHQQGTVSRNVTNVEFTDLENRLNYADSYGGIHWNEDHVTYNDGGLDSKVDVYIANTTQRGPAITFYSPSGAIVYALFIECANPDGDLSDGLPAADFDLTPTVRTNPLTGNVVSSGDSIQVIPKIDNAGPTASSEVEWQLSQFIVSSNGNYRTTMQDNNSPPKNWYGYGNKNEVAPLASGSSSFGVGNTRVGSGSQNIPDESVGTKICYALSVRPFSQDPGSNWRHSTPSCLLIGKKPMVQILGGDLQVGRTYSGYVLPATPSVVDTSTTVKDNGTKIYGSWAEYGVFAPSTVSGLASLSGLSGPDGNSSSDQSDWSKLTFANVKTKNCPAGFGCYNSAASMGTIPDIDSRYFKASDPDTAGGLNLNQGRGLHTYKHTGDLAIGNVTIEAGQSYVIKTTGNVTITGDIHYTPDTLHSLSDIPQLIIIANNIYINEGVANIDAWLIAKGTTAANTGILDTCAIGGDTTMPLSSNVCKTRLTVNGPVMAQHLWLRRTAGADTGAASGDPAEVFNLRSDAYLWANGQIQGSGRAQTVYTKELPPRF